MTTSAEDSANAKISRLASDLADIEKTVNDIRLAWLVPPTIAPAATKHRLNAAGEALIKTYEGFRSAPYSDGFVWGIGWGHTQGVTSDTPPISQDEAEVFFQQDVAQFEAMVDNYITVPLNENQYAALVSLTYNCGSAPLHMTLGTLLNAGDYAGAANEFGKWIHQQGNILPGLVTRRAAEQALFLTTV